ncbi:hypothetical protein F3J28_08110 [Enterobacter sp. Ap-1006]|uniref:hypothetical protein n=1 Tax=Enterobacter sp. Ap-1006 TaxID=2608345 RepID=UPI0014242DBA|nr:hypothetical protein [Enterobacter sp. Ap-1006]NIF47729.1 hypothetical protein [Enterobacter sp. Ap-1006]
MNLRILTAAMLIPLSATAALSPVEKVEAPGGKMVYYIQGDAETKGTEDYVGGEQITAQNTISGKQEILLTAASDADPKKTLYGFSRLKLSQDAKTLYFETAAWATSAAIHALDIASHHQRYVTDGSLICIVASGKYQGNLIVQQHRYFVQGGAYDYLYLFDNTGKKIGLVAGDNVTQEQVSDFCESLNGSES